MGRLLPKVSHSALKHSFQMHYKSAVCWLGPVRMILKLQNKQQPKCVSDILCVEGFEKVINSWIHPFIQMWTPNLNGFFLGPSRILPPNWRRISALVFVQSCTQSNHPTDWSEHIKSQIYLHLCIDFYNDIMIVLSWLDSTDVTGQIFIHV